MPNQDTTETLETAEVFRKIAERLRQQAIVDKTTKTAQVIEASTALALLTSKLQRDSRLP